MDAFAVALCKGLGMQKIDYTRCWIIALFFGGFQFIMPLLGWLLSVYFQTYLASFDYLIVFIILAFIGTKMMYESFRHCDATREKEGKFSIRELFLLAIATSIDALGVGITFVLYPEQNILFSASLIGVVTFSLSFLAVILGNKYGMKYGSKAEFVGGLILVGIACKTVFEHFNSV